MLEAKLEQAALLKRIVDSIRDIVQDCNFECSESGLSLQAMDNSHIALVSLLLGKDGFTDYRCDRSISLGVNVGALTKILKCGGNDDVLTLRAEDKPSVLSVMFEDSIQDRISEYNLKLMDVDQEHMGIPDTEYSASVTMPTAEFQRIARDLHTLSDSVEIDVNKEGITFSCDGDIGAGSIVLKPSSNIDRPEQSINVEIVEPVTLSFNLKYLNHFCKASGLSNQVTLRLSGEAPLLVEYKLPNGFIRFFLAPKIGDDEEA
ncbi:proliferating cell nuclear antigen [Nadsonia fulvescens var. elongata DSM 6958]|uniref:DNA sliding clamp PCNA n=1 Tax=Nadsonia fulvescens var. elongata DSM 6958 TaxID=857566 RepID=A0A1E3PF65_9ASCO|nr:proliferating cell nuclear antigen [Nadsonia fulvescens var. elongata DSM 6958]